MVIVKCDYFLSICSNKFKGSSQDDSVTANFESLPCISCPRPIVWAHFLHLCMPTIHHKLHRRHRRRIPKRSRSYFGLQIQKLAESE